MRLYDLLEKTAKEAIHKQRSDGSLPGGHNGLYNDPETPVRNTAHWLITFLKVYEITNQERSLEAAHNAADYLRTDDARPNGYTFYHRDSDEKNSCNGLIGQAWTIESLAIAADKLDDPELASLAEEVFLLHPFDDQLGLWKSVEIDGQPLGFDGTLNHQLWFAAAGGLLARNRSVSDLVNQSVSTFLDRIESNMELYDSGLIRHGVKFSLSPRRSFRLLRRDKRGRLFVIGLIGRSSLTEVDFLRNLVNHPAFPIRRPPLRPKYARMKAIGYHSFNLYALALLHRQYPDHRFWSSELFTKSYEYLYSDEYANNVGESKYGYPYNPPGIEVPFALDEFEENPDRELQEQWLTSQFQRCFDFDNYEMSKNTPDPRTLTARMYQATRLPNLHVSADRELQKL